MSEQVQVSRTKLQQALNYIEFDQAPYAVQEAIKELRAALQQPADKGFEHPINHAEAIQLAHFKYAESNLARCYVDLHGRSIQQPAAPDLSDRLQYQVPKSWIPTEPPKEGGIYKRGDEKFIFRNGRFWPYDGEQPDIRAQLLQYVPPISEWPEWACAYVFKSPENERGFVGDHWRGRGADVTFTRDDVRARDGEV